MSSQSDFIFRKAVACVVEQHGEQVRIESVNEQFGAEGRAWRITGQLPNGSAFAETMRLHGREFLLDVHKPPGEDEAPARPGAGGFEDIRQQGQGDSTASTTQDDEVGLHVEQALLGALLNEGSFGRGTDALARVDDLQPDHFSERNAHRAIFSAIRAAAPACDLVTVGETLVKEHGEDMRRYLSKLAQETPGAANIEKYAELVRKHARERIVGEWPEPQPLTSHIEALPYPLDALPGVIGAAVREVVEFVQCPAALAAMSALSAVSMAGQALADVRRAVRLEGPCSLYFLAVADSGERKTTCDGFFSRAVLDWEQRQAEQLRPEIEAHAAALKAWEQEREGVLSAIKKAAAQREETAELKQRLAALETERPRPLRRPRISHMDTTPEALAWSMARPDGWPSASVISSEAGIVFGGHGMARESQMRNLALLNTLWDGKAVTVDRRTTESFTLSGARLTIGLAAQPDTARAFFDQTRGLARGSGFAARFLIAWPESTQGRRAFKEGPDHWSSLAKFHRRVADLLDQTPTINDRGELEPVMLELSAEARAAWRQFHDEVERELRPGGEMADLRDTASKAADNAARLAALLHVFEHGPAGEVGADAMHAACRIVGWHLYEARRFFGELALPAPMANAVKLDAWLLRYCAEKRTATVSTRTVQHDGPVRERKALDDTLKELEDVGRVRQHEEGRRRLVQVNPLLLEGDRGAS